MSILAGFDTAFDAAFGSGASQSTTVPGKWEVALNGHGYRVDHAQDLNGFRGTHFDRKSAPVLRNQADVGASPGENSINREDLWRRAQETWHLGAGQTYLDRANSDNARFSTSKGVNVWSMWQATLLPTTSNQRASANTNLRLTAAGTYTYLADGNSLLFTSDITANPVVWTTVTGTPASSLLWLTSDGYTIYAAYAGGVYTTTRGAAAATLYNSLISSVLGYVKGRVMAANLNSIYNITSGATPTALLTHANTDFTWVGFAEGPAHIFAAGYSGARSLIYKISIQPDGTALAAPSVAGELPTGESIAAIKGYAGVLLIGTNLGVRTASIDSTGNLSIGPLIATTSTVLNFEPTDRFVWYGLTNYDSASSGMGRLDLSKFTSPLVPAYASDLMATGQGAVLSISTNQSRKIFTVSGLGVFVEGTTLVPSGTLTSGRITYGIADDKVAMYLDLRTTPLVGTIDANLAYNGGTAGLIGSHNQAAQIRPSYPVPAGQPRGEFFELTLTLNRAVATTTGPTLTRYTLRSYPAPNRSFTFTVPLILHNTVDDLNESPENYDVSAERAFLEDLCKTQALVTYQEGDQSYTVLLDDFIWIPIKQNNRLSNYEGTFVAQLKEVTQ